MIFEERIYDISPGAKKDHQAYLEENAVPVIIKHGAKLVGMWDTIIGERNNLYVLLGWDDLQHRDKSWQKIVKDPDFRPESAPAGSQVCLSCHARALAVNILRPTYLPAKPPTSGRQRLTYEHILFDVSPPFRPELLTVFAKELIPALNKLETKIIGVWETPIGDRNQVVCLLAFADISERMACWEKLEKVAAFAKCASYANAITISVLRATKLSPLK